MTAQDIAYLDRMYNGGAPRLMNSPAAPGPSQAWPVLGFLVVILALVVRW